MFERTVALLVAVINVSIALKVYKSTYSAENSGKLSGLKHLAAPNQIQPTETSFTACMRFNYQKLGPQSTLFKIDNPSSYTDFLVIIAHLEKLQ